MNFTKLAEILAAVLPFIAQLIQSKAVPFLKRKAYEKLDDKANKLIEDLARNASKITLIDDENKKAGFIEGTKLGIDTLHALADKLKKAADEIEKAI